jgi:SOS-response transcriptional repressor LexA
MPAKPLTSAQFADAKRLQDRFTDWQDRRAAQGLPASQADAAELLGFGQSAVSQYLRGAIPLNFRAATKFAGLLDCPVEAISPDIAEQARSLTERVNAHMKHYAEWGRPRGIPIVTPAPLPSTQDKPEEAVKPYPLLAWEEVKVFLTGDAISAEEGRPYFESLAPLSRKGFYLRVSGDSMKDPSDPRSFCDGDFIAVDVVAAYKSGSFVIVSTEPRSTPILRRLVVDGGKQYLEALNPAWPTKIVEAPPGMVIHATVVSKTVVF